MPHHYLAVISPGPLMILRVPLPMPRWRAILRATTAVMRAHGLRQKDVHQLDGLVEIDPADRDAQSLDLASRLDAALAGASNFAKAWLYDWVDGTFQLARPPIAA